jgi:hypothetical protein
LQEINQETHPLIGRRTAIKDGIQSRERSFRNHDLIPGPEWLPGGVGEAQFHDAQLPANPFNHRLRHAGRFIAAKDEAPYTRLVLER